MPGPASPWGYCPRVQVGDLNRDFLESGPQPLGLDATKKKVVNQNICKSVSYLLYCQAAVRLAGITIPEKRVKRIFLLVFLAVGETSLPAVGWDRWG